MLTFSFSSFFNIKPEQSIRTLPAVRADGLEFSLITAKGINKSCFAHVHEVESGLNGFFCHKNKKKLKQYILELLKSSTSN